jgi:hypothetical protein
MVTIGIALLKDMEKYNPHPAKKQASVVCRQLQFVEFFAAVIISSENEI